MKKMESATNNQQKIMPADELDEHVERQPSQEAAPQPLRVQPPAEPAKTGFFTIYKKGQGYWTRLCTALAAAGIVLFTAWFIYATLPPYIPWLASHRKWLIGIDLCFIVIASLLIWRIINKPRTVDFLIATDTEMKKVNWTSREELAGSTKVVIFFMVAMAATLFVLDILFGYLFYLLKVLKSPPL